MQFLPFGPHSPALTLFNWISSITVKTDDVIYIFWENWGSSVLSNWPKTNKAKKVPNPQSRVCLHYNCCRGMRKLPGLSSTGRDQDVSITMEIPKRKAWLLRIRSWLNTIVGWSRVHSFIHPVLFLCWDFINNNQKNMEWLSQQHKTALEIFSIN